ncbi:GntR family transcriptional regulator [Micromonospora sp. NPDC002389]|uniref:GntR family transcriptional regulator n=1 Tax=Micromonospora sp. NPDC002389 TaxID=3154272 RepID=UPI003328F55B
MPTPQYGRPRYLVIASKLRARVISGLIAPGSLLPSEGALMVEFKASRGTIRHALALLRDEGLVRTERGRGTVAAAQARTDGAGQEVDLSSHIIPASTEVSRLLGVPRGELVEEEQIVVRRSGKVTEIINSYRRLNTNLK